MAAAASAADSVGGFFKAMLPGQQAPKQQPASSLLADWNAYQQQHDDVEAGPSSSITRTAEEMGQSLLGVFRNGYTAVSDGISNVRERAPTIENTIPSGQQLVYFFCFAGAGCLFMLLAFMVGLPTLILAPSKFALCFTLGCTLLLASAAALKGWRAQLAHMMSKERLPFSAAYVGTVFFTLYAATILNSYVLSLVASGAQVVALAYYLTSYFPGGTSSVRFMLGMAGSAATSCLGAVQAAVFK